MPLRRGSRNPLAIFSENGLHTVFLMGKIETNSNRQINLEPLLTPVEAGAFLRVHEKTVIRYARQQILPALRLGGKHWRFRLSDLTDWAAEQVESNCQPDE
jgi:excisionase family DNA binding protein